ncbi:site-specific DNA-methyltransferase [Bradyrhizobium manausense]|uniref:DNA-methyltransferase n=1 Tax=Bradyrhizobium manausense TaxID=989370 RepID=UPI001BAAA16E|nr:DNA methyltransferase [Bradyrhizobium manausense]MBR1090620.1 site-specific DNA-methyltransferase [Bradyrhizobium manausense]
MAQNSHWDERLLGESLLELQNLARDFDLSITGFSLPEIDLAIQKLTDPVIADPDAGAGLETGVNVCQFGEVWELGSHRIYCGDATTDKTFARLMKEERAQVVFTDPHCNACIDGHESGKEKVRHRESAQAAGGLSREEFVGFLTKVCTHLKAHTADGAVHYITMDWKHLDELLTAGRAVYSELKDIVVRTNDNPGTGSLYQSRHKLICVFKSGAGPHINNILSRKNGRNRTNVWEYPSASNQARKGKNVVKLHSTVTPVSMVMDALLDCSNRGHLVLDCFLGSGTTLLAAERTGRICRAIELDGLYVDTAIRQWQNLTGATARRMSDGKSFRDVEAEIEGNKVE